VADTRWYARVGDAQVLAVHLQAAAVDAARVVGAGAIRTQAPTRLPRTVEGAATR